MVRNACFRRVELAAQRDWDTLGELDAGAGWDSARWEASFGHYFEEQASIGTGQEARSARLWQVAEGDEGDEGPEGDEGARGAGVGRCARSLTTPRPTTNGRYWRRSTSTPRTRRVPRCCAPPASARM